MTRGACLLCLLLSSLSAACARSDPPAASTCPPCASVPLCPGSVIVSVPMDLPAPPTPPAQPITIQIDVAANGDLHVDGIKVDDGLNGLLPVAQKAHASNPEVRATIRADKDARHGRVIEVLDILKQAAIARIAFGVSPASPAASSR